MFPALFRVACVGLVATLTSCASNGRASTADRATFAPALQVDLSQMTRTEDGLYYRDIARGTGAPALVGRRVAVRYVAWLPDGTEVDAQLDPEPPITFRLGAGEVIRGWEIGVQGMRVGGQRQLVVPPELGYGRRGAGRIPRHAVLVFTIHLVAVE